ncbi:MAG: T9SS type A sorting domain-containing protein, partial [Ginsengibacter sp.]
NNNLTLKSTLSGTAAVADVTGNTILGNVTVERFFSINRKWRYLSIPTNTTQTVKAAWQEGAASSGVNPVPRYGTQVTDSITTWAANGFDYLSPQGPSVKKFNAALNNYIGIANTSVPIASREGWMTFVRGDRTAIGFYATPTITTLRTKGSLITGNQDYPVTALTFTSIGNPYASPLDMTKISKPGVQEFFYVWDPNLTGSAGLGAFQTFSLGAGNNYFPTPGGGSYPSQIPVANSYNYIQSGLAFFVRGAGSSGNVAITESSKASSIAAGNALVFRPASGNLAQLRTNLYAIESNASTDLVDGVLNHFDEKYSNGFDIFDAIKMQNFSENLAIKTDGQLLVIERRHTVEAEDTIHFNMLKMKVKSYRFEFTGQNFDPALTAFLEDSSDNSRTILNLNGTSHYDFNITNDYTFWNPNRFRIVFATDAQGPLPVTFSTLKAFQQDKDIAVAWTAENEKNVKQYEVEKSADGQHFTPANTIIAKLNNGSSVSYQWLDVNALTGNNFYRIKSIDINGVVRYSNVVKIVIGQGRSQIMAYPNPITDGNINLQLINQPKGKYGIRLMNKLGQVMMVNQIQHQEGSSTETLKIKLLVHGAYQLEVTKPDKSKININVLY